MKVKRATKETSIDISFAPSKKKHSCSCSLKLVGKGDFKHHLIEDAIITLAESFNMVDHLDHVISILKIKKDNAKEIKSC